MQPYQRATEETNRQQALPGQALGTAASLIGAASAGGALFGRIAPLLSNYVPQTLALKGLSRINPTLGKFAQTALNQGESWDGVKDFITNKFEEEKQNNPEEKSILKKYDPELHRYIEDSIKTGIPPLKVAAHARKGLNQKFKKAIEQIEKDYKTDFGSIVESIFGNGQLAAPQEIQQEQAPQQQQQIAPQAGGGSGQEMLMQMLQKINQRMGQ